VRGELEAYGHGLDEKPEIVALSQGRRADADERKKKAASLKRAAGHAPLLPCLPSPARVSKEVLRALMVHVEDARRAEEPPAPDDRWSLDRRFRHRFIFRPLP
jgi:GTP-binding protein